MRYRLWPGKGEVITVVGRRIVLVVDGDTADIATQATDLARGLIQRGDRVTIAGPVFDGVLRDTGAAYIPVAIPVDPRPLEDARAVWVLRGVMRGPAGGGPDVIHAFGPRAGLAALLSKTRNARLVVGWLQSIDTEALGAAARVRNQADRAVARGADVNLCVNADLVATVHRLGAHDARHIELGVRQSAGTEAIDADLDDGIAAFDDLYRELTGI